MMHPDSINDFHIGTFPGTGKQMGIADNASLDYV